MIFLRFFLENSTEFATARVQSGSMLHDAAAQAGVPLRKDCGGHGTCGKCKVLIGGNERLACQTVAETDLDVIVPKSSLADTEIVVVTRSATLADENAGDHLHREHSFAVALDIGTTTLAAALFDLSQPKLPLLGVQGCANPQRRFGDDVVSRIQKIIEDPDCLPEMQSLLLETVGQMLQKLAQTTNIIVSEIKRLSVAGNTVMEHLFLGIDPSPLGVAPFRAPVSEFPVCHGSDIGLMSCPDCLIETMPILGGFVGGDITAGILATGMYEAVLYNKDETALLLDIGTNGELAFCHRGGLFISATAAGPAFEGGRIEYGMAASAGAIDKAEFHEDGTLSLSTIDHAPPQGICGSGLIDLVSELLRHGLLAPNGRFQVRPDSPFLKHWKIVDDQPAFELLAQNESGRAEAILLTQRDVRQFQLAVGAIRSGMVLLLRQAHLTAEDIETFYVAGGFGSFIRLKSAQRVGLLPPEIPWEHFQFCGNTALAGARLPLLNPNFRNDAVELSRRAKHVELAEQPDFATVFAEAMIF